MLSCIRWLITCNKSWLKLTNLCVHTYIFIFLQFVHVMFNVFLPNIIQIVSYSLLKTEICKIYYDSIWLITKHIWCCRKVCLWVKLTLMHDGKGLITTILFAKPHLIGWVACRIHQPCGSTNFSIAFMHQMNWTISMLPSEKDTSENSFVVVIFSCSRHLYGWLFVINCGSLFEGSSSSIT